MKWNQVIFLEFLKAGLAYRPRLPSTGAPAVRLCSPMSRYCQTARASAR